MNNQETLQNLLQNMILGIEKLERRNEQEINDLLYCQELNKDILKLIESCDNLLIANSGLSHEESRDLNKDSLLSSTRLNKIANPSTLLQEYSSARNPKTPGRMNKSVNKTRESSHEKDKLFKTKTLANLKNFTSTAKNLKSDNKLSFKTPTNYHTNKSLIFHNEKEISSFDQSSRNKTVIVEKVETGLKKDKTKSILTHREESIIKIKIVKIAKTPREKLNISSAFRKEAFKNISEIKSQNSKHLTESSIKKKDELKDVRRNNGSFTITSVNNDKIEKSKEKVKQLSNVNMAKVEKKEEKKEKADLKKNILMNEKESLMTNISSNYGSNKNEDLPSPSNINNKFEIKFPNSINNEYNSETNTDHFVIGDKNNLSINNNEINVKKPSEIKEEVIDPKVINEKRNKCMKFVIDLFLNKYEYPTFLGVNKDLSKSAINHLKEIFKAEYNSFEEKVKQIKEKHSLVELSKEIPPFVVARGTTKAVELLNESLYNKLFSNIAVPSDDILMPYKIYFQLINNSFASIKDDKIFWENCCNYFLNQNNGKTGDLINNSVKNFDFSEENLWKIMKVIGNREKKITPTYYSKTCGTTGLIIFLIKDAMEYAGIIIDKKTLPARTYKTYNYLLSKARHKLDRMDEFEKKFLAQH